MSYPSYRNQRSDSPIGNRGPGVQLATGIIIILIGVGVLLRKLDAGIPRWILGWEMLLIAIGLIMGLRGRFKDISWVIPIMVGMVFLADRVMPGIRIGQLAWPVIIIAFGLIVALKPGFRFGQKNTAEDINDEVADVPMGLGGYTSVPEAEKSQNKEAINDPEDFLDLTAVFGGVKRIIVSKNFKGGEVVAVLGGAEIDLTHADFNGVIRLEAVNVLGGTKIRVPPTWDVQSEMVAVFGGVEDKRQIQPGLIDKHKKLILEGTCFLGGLEIRNY